MSVAPAHRKLTPGHFAFMRAVVQGIDLRASWDRYLRTEGEHEDLRKVRSTIARMRGEFAAAAKRCARPGTARLMMVKADEVKEAAPLLPSLADFAAERGLEDFSEREQQEAFVEAYGSSLGARRQSRRARLVQRQLEALRWLEQLVAQNPSPSDSVAAWFAPSIAARLAKAKLHTLADLIGRVNGVGARWWTAVPGVGELKASRILDWLRLYEPSIGLPVGSHVAARRCELQPAQLDQVVACATAIVPFEKFLLPAGLDGRQGRFRAPAHQCLLEARNDHEAIAAWLATKHDPNGTSSTSTHRAYRKEAERLLLWAIVEHGKPLSSLSVEDVGAFMCFLAAPSTRWCGPRHHQRWSPLWRPLEGPLSVVARRQSVVILRSLFAFLVSQNYLLGNAFSGVALPREQARPRGSMRTLTFGQWEALEERLDAIALTSLGRRQARAIRWLYATGLRLAELAGAQCGDLRPVDDRRLNGQQDAGWRLSVVGKGDKRREVPVATRLVEELQNELAQDGLEPNVTAAANRKVAILTRVESGVATAWSASGLAKGIKDVLERCAASLELDDARQLRKASTHWFRRTHGSHAVNGRPGGESMPLQVVQANLGHASIRTTTGYLATERDARPAETKGFDTTNHPGQ